MATKTEYLMAHIEDRLQDIANDMYELQQENKALRAENGRLRAELDEARELLKKVLSANSQSFKNCPDCGERTLWQHQEQSDEYGWEVNDYCYECGYDPVNAAQ